MELGISNEIGSRTGTEPGAVATRSYIQSAADDFEGTKTWGAGLSAGSGSYRSRFCNDAVRRFCLIVLLIGASTGTATGQTPPSKAQEKTSVSAVQSLRLSPEAAQVAEEIGVTSLVDQL